MSLYGFGVNRDGQCGTTEICMPSTPTRAATGMGQPQGNRYKELVSPTLRGEEPPSVIVPRPVRLSINISSVSAGSRHTLALSDEGAVYSWGWGSQGQLGLSHFNSVVFPTRVEGLPEPIALISAGGIHSSCLGSSGQCYSWGSNEYGQLGQGPDVSNTNKPALVISEEPDFPLYFSKISSGGMHSAAIDLSGNLWCWGRADSGQTGSGKWVFSFFPGALYPKRVSGISGVVDVRCGGFHTVILTENGHVMAMGKEDFGVLGTGISNSKKMKQGTETLTDVVALAEERVVGISCGGWHSMFWTDRGKLYSCGKGEYGRLGIGTEQNVPAPTLVTFDDPTVRVVSASCGGSHSLILSSDGRVFSVGRSDDGRLGLGTDLPTKVMKPRQIIPGNQEFPMIPPAVGDNSVAPAPVEAKFDVLQIEAGGAHSFILVRAKAVARNSTEPL